MGETHKSMRDRMEEHIEALRTRDCSYAVVKHWNEEHEGEDEPMYEFEVAWRGR